MLVRAASRKARPESIRPRTLYEPYLPWLYPTYHGKYTHRAHVSMGPVSQGGRLGQKSNTKDAPNMRPRRTMATAFAVPRPIDDIPFEGMRHIPPAMPEPQSVGDYSLNPTSHLGMGTSQFYPNDLLDNGSRLRPGNVGVSGDFYEINSVFQACLQVGRFERAGLILKRLCTLPGLTLEHQFELHKQYIRAAVEDIVVNPTATAMQNLCKWFELQVRDRGIHPDTEMIAYMVKVSLQEPHDRHKRLIRRYMDLLDEENALQVLDAGIFSAFEINQIAQIYPKYNFATAMEDGFDDDVHTILDEAKVEGNITSTDSATVRPTIQKGLGLSSLKKSLSLFTSLPDQGICIAAADPQTRREIQKRLEDDAVESAIQRWRDDSSHLTKMGLNSVLQTKSLGARMWKWQLALEEHLIEELKQVEKSEMAEDKNSEDHDRCMYGPLLRVLPPKKLAAVTILSAMNVLGTTGKSKSVPLASLILAISRSVEDENSLEIAQKIAKKNQLPKSAQKRMTPEYLRKASLSRGPGTATRLVKHLTTVYGTSDDMRQPWPQALQAKVGAILMSALIEVAKVPCTLTHAETKEQVIQLQPAFFHALQYRRGKRIGVITLNESLIEQLKREPVHSLLAKQLPMLVEPDPWTGFNTGGFISHPSKIMRIKAGDKDQRQYAEAAIDQGNMSTTFRGLDVLGRTSWRINKPLFDVMLEAWNSGEAIANLAPEDPKLNIPPEPPLSKDPLERGRWLRAVKLAENQRSGFHSQRCFQNFQLEIARALRNEVFYFPHNIDFRGRAYPIPPYLNHIGADHCRGLLMFGDGKELGAKGLKWLKVHLANVYGFDKASLLEREEFTMKNLDAIYDSALRPLTGNRWWLNAEDPWQCLAACMEIRNALHLSDPEKYISHLPVHQDGTCNGLQHYAALGGDILGAKQVNLEPGDRPADVYTAVADLVKESIAKDSKMGNPIAKFMEDKITRKTVKQTVMTNVYGVTFIGAKAQVRRQLVAAHPNLPNDNVINPGILSSYVAAKIFTALGDMFRGAHDIQFWLGECANRISTSLTPEQLSRLEAEWPKFSSKPKGKQSSTAIKDRYNPKIEELALFKSSVVWTNPLDMPVVQPYRKNKTKGVDTKMQRVHLSEPHRTDPVSKKKQLQGFPPNFIHSLDASHMLLSATKCDELGLTFAAVHDSFWTHAADVDTMNNVLRDSFIRIHSEDIVSRLAAEFSTRYKGSMFLAQIKTKTPLHQKIVAWRATKTEELKGSNKSHLELTQSRKMRRFHELMLECKRQRLLASSNPAEVEEGRNMETPASIFEAYAGEEDFSVEDDLQDMSLGTISNEDGANTSDTVRTNELSSTQPIDELETNERTSTESEDHDEEILDNVDEAEMGSFEKELTQKHKTTPRDQIWLPLVFPPVPKKGEFDVTRLKGSKYFFS